MPTARVQRITLATILLLGTGALKAADSEPVANDQFLEAFARGDAVSPPTGLDPPHAGYGSRRPRHPLAGRAEAVVTELRRAAADPEHVDLAKLLSASEALDQAAAAHFATVRGVLGRAGLGAVILDRLAAAESRYRSTLGAFQTALEEIADDLDDGTPATRLAAQGLAIEALSTLPGPASPPIRGVLPYRSLRLPPRAPTRTPLITPSHANPLATPATSLDLQETPEARHSAAIHAQAAALDYDYARIYDFVRNDVRTEWYAGSLKGAEGTLRSGSGNDVDQASLLIALFRASQLPARYLRGVVRLPVELLAASLGLADDQEVPTALARAGVAHEVVLGGGRIDAVDIEHTWVTAYAPYANYRGVIIDFSGATWIPLAPAIQGTDWQQATGVLGQMSFDAEAFVGNYLSTLPTTQPLDRIRQQVESFLAGTGETYDDQLGSRRVATRRLEFLPNAMPSTAVLTIYEGPTLPQELAPRLSVTTWAGPQADSMLSLETAVELFSLTGRRLTISYTPATAEDDAVVNLFGGLDLVPPYLVDLLPQIKLTGHVIAVGTEPIPMATQHLVRIAVEGPGVVATTEYQAVAVAYSALAIHTPGGAPIPDPGDDPGDTEKLAAHLLNQIAQRYGQLWHQSEDELAGLLDVAVVRPLCSLAIAHNRLAVESLLDIPLRVEWEGVDLDAALRVAEPFANRDSDDTGEWFALAALQGSALERGIFEREFLVASISADLGLGQARDDGLEVALLTPANVDLVLDAADFPLNVESAVRQQVLAGYRVELPTAEVSFGAWTGAVWRALDSASGTAGYFIAGGLAGGATAELPGNWVLAFLADALAAPYSPEPNEDPLAGVEISKLPEGDDQSSVVGEVFPRLLQVRVRDALGRPVQGASVAFTSERGEGRLIDSQGVEHPSELTTTTNSQGIAGVILRAGTEVDSNPTYVFRSPDDPVPTAVLGHEVGARVQSADREFGLALPFRAIAFPGAATGLERTDLVDPTDTHFVGRVGFLSDVIPVRAIDAFGNAISNLELRFEVGPPSAPDPSCSNPSPGPLNAALFDLGDTSACPPSLPAIGYCGEPVLTRTTGPRPVTAGVILGNSISSQYAVSVSAPTAPELGTLSFTYSSIYSIVPQSGRCMPGAPLVEDFSNHVVYSRTQIDSAGNNIQAAAAGAPYWSPIDIRFAAWDADDGEICTPQLEGGCGEPYFQGELESGVWVPADGNIQLTLDTEGSLAAVQVPEAGLFRTLLGTDVLPALNSITFEATEIASRHHLECLACTIDCPDPDPTVDCQADCPDGLAPESCVYCPLCTLDCPGPDCDADCPEGGPTYPAACLDNGRGPSQLVDWGALGIPRLTDTTVNGVWGVAPTIEGFDPDPVPLSEGGAVLADTTVTYGIEPTEYVALSAAVEVHVNDTWDSSAEGSSRSGTGSAGIRRGYGLSIDDVNTVELVLNRGTPAEVRSSPTPIPLGQTIFAPGESSPGIDLVTKRRLFVSQDVDLLNQRVCAIPDLFFFTLTQASSVTLTLEKIGSVNPDGSPVFDAPIEFLAEELLDEGEHSYSVTPGAGAGDFSLPPGDYRFTLAATSVATGLAESFTGTARSELRISDHLPIGHVLVHGVDMFDGHLTLSREDLSVPGRGVALELRRSYSSTADRQLRALGVGWTHNYDSYLTTTPCGEVILVGGEGSGMRFVDDGAGGLAPLRGHHGSLIANPTDSSFDFYSRSGIRFHYVFEPRSPNRWQLDFIEDPNANRTRLVYDPNTLEPLLAAVVDPAGRQLQFEYENRVFSIAGDVELKSGPVLVRVQGPDAMVAHFEYDEHGHLIRAAREGDARVEQYGYDWVNDPLLTPRRALLSTTNGLNGATTSYAHQAGVIGVNVDLEVARLLTTQVTEPENGVTQYVYDTGGLANRTTPELVHQLIDPRGFTTTYRLNQYGAPLSITDPLDHTTAMTWPPDDILMASRTDANGNTTSFQYDEHANLLAEEIAVVDAAGTSHTYRRENTFWPPETFDPPTLKDRVATRTDRNGHTTRFEYDVRGNLTLSAITVGAETIETLHEYSSNGDRFTTTDPRGAITQFTYDSYGNLASVRDPLGHLTETAWNARSLPIRSNDPLDRETLFAYDTLGRLRTKTMPLGAITSTDHDDVANTVTRTDAELRVTIERYDLQGRRVETTNPAGGTQLMEYDPAGNKTLETTWFDAETPRHDVTFEYDDAGRLIRRHEPLGRTTDFAHDAVGNVTAEVLTDAGNAGFAPRRQETDYDELDRPKARRRFLGTEPVETTLLLDGERNLLRKSDGLLRQTTHTYDALDRRTETLEPNWRPGEGKRTTFDYDPNGNLVREVRFNDPLTQERTFAYDPLNRLTERTDAAGGITSLEYDAVGNLLRETDPNGNGTSHLYDPLDRRVSSTHHLTRTTSPPRNVTTTFEYDLVGNLTLESWPNGNVVASTYDPLDRLVATGDSLGPATAATYDARGNRLTATDANGNLTTNTHDVLDRLTLQELPEDRFLAFTYDVAGNRLSATNPRGFTTAFVYDSLDRRLETRHPETEGVLYIESSTYDLVGNRLSTTDPRGLTTTFGYDDLDRLTTVTDPPPLSYITAFEYDALGNRIRETDRRGIDSRTEYDAENRPTRIERDGVTVRTISYDPAGNKVRELDALGQPSDYTYDERNLLVAVHHPLENESMGYTLDDMGDRLKTLVGFADPTTTIASAAYDLRRRLSSETNGAGETTRYEVDGNGNRTALVRPADTRWEYDFDGADRLSAVRDPIDNSTSYLYDRNGNLESQTDAENRTTSFVYDALDRRLRKTYPDGASRTAAYDGSGNRTGATDALGRTTTYEYDVLNRETRTSYPLPTPPTGDDLTSITTTFDPNGNPTRIDEAYSGITGVRSTLRTYDTFDRVTSVLDPQGQAIGYQYFATGNRSHLTDPQGQVTGYTYDSRHRVTRLEVPGSGNTLYSYLPTNDLFEITYPEGTRATHSYDTPGRTTAIEHRRNGALVSRFDYGYGPNGNRLSQREQRFDGLDELTTYAYDAADRLEQVTYPDRSVTYTYDGVGNRLTEVTTDSAGNPLGSQSATFNSRHQLTALTDHLDPADSVAYTYDPNGSQTSKTTSGDTTTYSYDLRDHLTEITNATGLVGRYHFDYQGLRIRKETATHIQRFVWDDQSLLTTTDDAGAPRAKYNHGPRHLLSLQADNQHHYYFTDVLGSPFQISNLDGTVDTYTQYDAWGNTRHQTPGTAPDTFGFTGYQNDGESGLDYAKARFYDPEMGRFLREDPFEGTGDTPPSLHRYLYGYANPTVWVDPSGEINVGIAIREAFEAGEKAVSALAVELNETELAQTGLGKQFVSGATKALGVAGGTLELAAEGTDQVNNLVNIALLFQSDDGFNLVRDLKQQAKNELTDDLLDGVRALDSTTQLAEQIQEDPAKAGTQLAVFAMQKTHESAEFIRDLRNGEPGAVYETTRTLTKLATLMGTERALSPVPKRLTSGLRQPREVPLQRTGAVWDGPPTSTQTTAIGPQVEVEFLQESRGGSIKPAGFVSTDTLKGLSATEANILVGADLRAGTVVERVRVRIPLFSLEKPLSGNRLFVQSLDSLVEGRTIGGLAERIAPRIPDSNVVEVEYLGEVLKDVP